jgi:hypothetical protein
VDAQFTQAQIQKGMISFTDLINTKIHYLPNESIQQKIKLRSYISIANDTRTDPMACTDVGTDMAAAVAVNQIVQ